MPPTGRGLCRPHWSGIWSAVDLPSGCIAGTIPLEEYRGLLVRAGFEALEIEVHSTQGVPDQDGVVGSAYIRAAKPGP